jgi:hypothetical protein
VTSLHPLTFCSSVVDDGPGARIANERYKIVYYVGSPNPVGPRVAFSPDGLNWTRSKGGEPALVIDRPSDSFHAAFDPIRQRYFLILKLSLPYTWTNAEGQKIAKDIRCYGLSFSQDFKTWSPYKMIFAPDTKDPGVTEWYGMSGFQTRGDLIIGFLQVLRDDLTAEGAPAEAIAANKGNVGAGIGYTVLAWTRDGETWHRDRHTDKFLEPDPKIGAWDHAVTWIDSSVIVGDEVFLYYAGYRWGHKFNRFVDRQLGMVKVARDRFVARQAGPAGGRITTPVVTLAASQMTLNIDAQAGEVRAQIVDSGGKLIPGFSFADCQPFRGDSLEARVEWKRPLVSIKDQPIRLEFELKNARLYGFALGE